MVRIIKLLCSHRKYLIKFFIFFGRVVLFFYPMDFTFVCPTEILAFNDALSQFTELETEVLGKYPFVLASPSSAARTRTPFISRHPLLLAPDLSPSLPNHGYTQPSPPTRTSRTLPGLRRRASRAGSARTSSSHCSRTGT